MNANRTWVVVLAAVLSATVAAAAEPPVPAVGPAKIDTSKDGTYTSGTWEYRFRITNPGTRSEGRDGELLYDGKRLADAAGMYDYYLTPWGRIGWVGRPVLAWQPHGWMPQDDTFLGRQLPDPAGPQPAKISEDKDGTYEYGGWKYVYRITAPGTKSEGSVGELFYDGRRLTEPLEVNGYYMTPWGRIGWVGDEELPWGPHGWMPQVAGAAGRQLPDPAAGPVILKVGKEMDGKTLTVAVGRQIEIRLAGNPTTGYQWTLRPIEGEAIKAAGDVTYQASAARPGLVGGGGTFSLLLNAAAAGTAKVTLVYARSWEKDKPPAETFTATFAVKPVPASLPIPQE